MCIIHHEYGPAGLAGEKITALLSSAGLAFQEEGCECPLKIHIFNPY